MLNFTNLNEDFFKNQNKSHTNPRQIVRVCLIVLWGWRLRVNRMHTI